MILILKAPFWYNHLERAELKFLSFSCIGGSLVPESKGGGKSK